MIDFWTATKPLGTCAYLLATIASLIFVLTKIPQRSFSRRHSWVLPLVAGLALYFTCKVKLSDGQQHSNNIISWLNNSDPLFKVGRSDYVSSRSWIILNCFVQVDCALEGFIIHHVYVACSLNTLPRGSTGGSTYLFCGSAYLSDSRFTVPDGLFNISPLGKTISPTINLWMQPFMISPAEPCPIECKTGCRSPKNVLDPS